MFFARLRSTRDEALRGRAEQGDGVRERRFSLNGFFVVEMHGQLCFPNFFLDKRNDRRQLESVCKVLGDLPGGSKLQFFTNPKGSLGGRTPLDAIADGKVAFVRRVAKAFVER